MKHKIMLVEDEEALALLLKPIDNFVEHIVIKKTVEPGLDYFSKSLKKE